MDERRLDLVFEGGGARGLALTGAVAELEKHGYTFGRLVGTSAGAITATLVAVGYAGDALRAVGLERLPSGKSRMTKFIGPPGGFDDATLTGSVLGHILASADLPFVPEALERRVDLWTLRALLAIEPFAHVFSFVERGGFYGAEGFEAWLVERLDADGRNMSKLTLEGLHARTGTDLSLIVSDTSARCMRVLNHRTAPSVPVVRAVRMSMSIPFVWPEVIWDEAWGTYRGERLAGHAIMDGGLVSNFALRLLVSDAPWVEEVMGGAPDPQQRVLGLCLDAATPVAPGTKPEYAIHLKSVDRIERVFDTALEGNDTTEQEAYASLVCKLPTGGYGTLEFDMSQARIEALMNAGARAIDGWLARRGNVTASVHEARTRLGSFVHVAEPRAAVR